MPVIWLAMFKNAHWMVFVLGVALFVLSMTNLIMDVVAIAISLPVSLVIAKYLGVAPHVILYASLVTAGMPFALLIGTTLNATASGSKQFTTDEFITHGLVMSALLMIVLAGPLLTLWPMLGMPITLK